MPHDIPRKPSGSDDPSNYFRRQHEQMFEKGALIAGPGVRIDNSRRGKVITAKVPPPRILSNFGPFSIYQVPAGQCVTPADSWRTFQVRGGIVGHRFPYLVGLDYDHRADTSDNFEFTIPISALTDGLPFTNVDERNDGTFTQGFIPNAGADGPGAQVIKLVSSTPSGAVFFSDVSPAQFVLCDNVVGPHGGTFYGCSFYIKLTQAADDDPGVAPFGYIVAKMLETGYDEPFPTDPTILPIGTVRTKSGWIYTGNAGGAADNRLFIDQILRAHAVGRYPGSGPLTPGHYRGNWTTDATLGSGGPGPWQTFYPGDTVSTGNPAGGSGTIINLWKWKKATPDTDGIGPSISNANWELIAGKVP